MVNCSFSSFRIIPTGKAPIVAHRISLIFAAVQHFCADAKNFNLAHSRRRERHGETRSTALMIR
jgi:hypothetical protein